MTSDANSAMAAGVSGPILKEKNIQMMVHQGGRWVQRMVGCALGAVALMVPTFGRAQMTMPGQFAVSPSGAATYSIPIQVPPGVAGMEPKLALVYNSQAGNGLLGVGWSLSGLSSITRCPRTMAQDGARGSVNYDTNDRYCLDGQRLIAISGTDGANGTEYRTEQDAYSKVTSYSETGSTNGPGSFMVKTKSGLTMEFGKTEDSRIEAQGRIDTSGHGVVVVWALNKVTDAKGNYYTISYTEDNTNGQFYPLKLDFSGNSSATTTTSASIKFTYESRTDFVTRYAAGSLNTLKQRPTKIQTYVNTSLTRELRLGYHYSQATARSVMDTITTCDGGSICQPPLKLTFSEAPTKLTRNDGWANLGAIGADFYHDFGGEVGVRIVDLNGDGLPDLLHLGYYTHGQFGGGLVQHAYINTGLGYVRDDSWVAGMADDVFYHDMGGAGLRIVDLNGDGLPDLLHLGYYTNKQFGGGYIARAYINNGHGFTRNDAWAQTGSDSAFYHDYGSGDGMQIVDLNGDGLPDLIHTGYYLNAQFGGGSVRRAFINTGRGFVRDDSWAAGVDHFYHDYGGAGVRIVDLNEDGLPDILHLGYYTKGQFGGGLIAHAFINTGSGFVQNDSWANLGADSVFYHDYGGGGLQLVDLNGDGLPDLLHLAYYTHGQCGGGYIARAYINTGKGFLRNDAWAQGMSGSFFYHDMGSGADMQVVDVNGDGLPDLLHMGYYTNGQLGGGSIVRAFINNGKGFTQDNSWAPPGEAFYHSYGGTGARLIDLNGDGLQDWLHLGYYTHAQYGTPNGNGGEIRQGFVNSRAADMDALLSIKSGIGGSISVTYRPMTNKSNYSKGTGALFPVQEIQPPIWSVVQVDSANGVLGTSSSQYFYGGMRADVIRGSLGFQWTQSQDVATGLVSRTCYRQDWPYVGLVDKVMTATSEASLPACNSIVDLSPLTATGSNLLSLTVNAYKFQSYAPSDTSYASPTVCQDDPVTGKTSATCPAAATQALKRYQAYGYQSLTQSRDWDGSTFIALPASRTTVSQDNWGNVTQVKAETLNTDGKTASGYSKTTSNTYLPVDTANWLLGRLQKSQVQAVSP